jgi:Plasmid recombination enzyme
MGQAVLHFEKHTKPTSGTLGHHIDRTEGKEYSFRHADLSRTKNNAYIKVNELCSLPYNEAILKRVEQGYNARNKAGELKAIRKDAVYSVNTMLSGSHEDLKRIEKDPILMDKWIQKNLEFCKKHFGAENITRFAVHLDEKTPHIHCSFVPLTADGRLSANDIIGTGLKLEEFQTLYAKEMEEFGLERGVKSDRKHHTTEEYRKRELYKLDDRKDILKDLEDLKQSDVFSFKAKKEALMTKLMNLILEQDQNQKKELEGLKKQIEGLYANNRELTMKNSNLKMVNSFINEQEKEKILDNFDLIEYFFYLANNGNFTFQKKSAGEYYFIDGDRKISVNQNGKGYFDHKSGIGGQKIKAVMEFGRLNWLDAMHFMKQFSHTITGNMHENIREEKTNLSENETYLNAILRPNNKELLSYFEQRGISQDVIKEYSKQIHYQIGEKHSFGIGFKNVENGWDIRNSIGKMKIAPSSYSKIGKGKNVFVFEGMTDLFSYVQMRKNKKQEIDDELICLNSTTNVNKFILDYQNFEGNVYCILDAGAAADKATNDICAYFGKNAVDLRPELNIGTHAEAFDDLNDLLVDKINLMKKKNASQNEIDNYNRLRGNLRR